ncbi:DUF5819 family protein [Leucobacter sp. HY1910]
MSDDTATAPPGTVTETIDEPADPVERAGAANPVDPAATTASTGVAETNQETQQIAPARTVKPWVRVVAGLATVLTAWQVFASFLWIAPYSPLREVVPGNMLTSYMIPFFGQSWSVFAPEPINGDYHFNVRAIVEEDGQDVETGWVSATDVELSMIEYNLFPPRAGIQSSEVASKYKGAYDALGQGQKQTVASAFTSENWESELREALLAGSIEGDGTDLLGDDADEAAIEELIAQEHLSTAYATQVARAIWGDEVKQVQFRVSRQNIIPFAERHTPGAERPAPMMTESGLRALTTEPGQNDANFGRTFRAQFERITQ